MNSSRSHHVRHIRFSIFFILAFLIALSFGSSSAATPYDWLQFGFNAQHSGNNTQEALINAGNVSQLAQLFKVTLPASPNPKVDNIADGSPVYLTGVNTTGGVRDLVFVTTKAADLIALDAHTGAGIWTAHNPGPLPCTNTTPAPCYTTASPAIDPNRNFIYSYGIDGFVHKYNIGSGIEVTGNGWPEIATTKTTQEKGSSDLTVTATRLYVTNGGYPNDQGDYQGHLTTINLATGAQNIFNTVCSNQFVHFVLKPGTPDCAEKQAAVWSRSGAVYDPDNNRLFIVTGNATFDPAIFAWGDTVLALNSDGTGAGGGNPVDTYTPTNFATLGANDADLGSTSPAVLPPIGGRHHGVQGGKDAKLRIINLDNLSGQGVPGKTGGEIAGSLINVPQGNEVLTQPVVWQDPQSGTVWVFVGNDNGIAGLPLNANEDGWAAGGWTVTTTWCTSPIVANNVLYCTGSNDIKALNPTTGAQLWNDTTIGGIHWESPILANGILYITDEGRNLTAYSLNGVLPPTVRATATATQPAVTGTSTSSGGGPTISGADPAISKVGNPSLALPGEIVTFTITVTNNGSIAATNVIVTDPINDPLQFVSASASQGTFRRSGITFTFLVGTVNPGQVVTLTIVTRVRADAKPPFDVVNTAFLNNGKTASASTRITSGSLPSTGEHP